ncbi:MAG: homoprotocatechuate degradation operon regulator HpaR [Neisseria sp.]|nr:homoprotocatechuate degradation operon regulator HpaR [Neisseria sp.]
MSDTVTQNSLNAGFLQAREAMLAYFRPVLNKWDITEQQWRIVRVLAEQGQQDFHVLADKACLLRPSLTGILKRVEQAGLIARRKPALDQRKVLLKLTAKGEKLYQEMCVEIDERQAVLAADLGSGKLKELQKLLQELKDVSDKRHNAGEQSA